MPRNEQTARIRNDREASFSMVASATGQQSAYDRIGRNALAYGPIRVYSPTPTRLQRIARAIIRAL